MAKEIELKIRLNDPKEVIETLRSHGQSEGEYSKCDTYFWGPQGSFRLREIGVLALVCRKEKTIEQGIEINRETEFEVGDPTAFREFADSLGYRHWYQKEKKGESWRWGEVLVEVGTVSDLGWFAELELLLVDDADDQAVSNARQRLLSVVDGMGLPRSRIENRTYAQLLGHRES